MVYGQWEVHLKSQTNLTLYEYDFVELGSLKKLIYEEL